MDSSRPCMAPHPDSWVLYDFLLRHGGAEYTTVLLQRELDCRICTAFVEADNLLGIQPDAVATISRKRTFPGLATLDGLWSFYRKTRFLRSHSGPVIYSGSNGVMGVHNHPGGKNILYCHTIPRFAYDMRGFYRDGLPAWQKPLFDVLCRVTAACYEQAVRKMDTILVNSRNVQQRMHHYLGLDSQIVHPPVDTARFNYLADDGYYLSTARLEDYKGVDSVIRAFQAMPDKQLVVASSGRQDSFLRGLAGNAPNIRFTGWVDDEALQELVGRARATVYMPRDEDFGISPVESMAAGKPVIGADEGGVLETVVHMQTGYLCPARERAIREAVCWLDRDRAAAMRHACEQRAVQFDKAVFVQKMASYLR